MSRYSGRARLSTWHNRRSPRSNRCRRVLRCGGSAIILEVGLNALLTSSLTARSSLLKDLSIITRLRKIDYTSTSTGRALARDVCSENRREGVDKGTVILATDDFDGCADHVHLSVANLVKPGPSEDSRTILHIFGDRNVELLGTLLSGIIAALRSILTTMRIFTGGLGIARRFSRATADDAVNSVPLARILRRFLSIGDAELTRSTAVDSATPKLDKLSLSGCNFGDFFSVLGAALAGEGKVGAKRPGLVERFSIEVEGMRFDHDYMARGKRSGQRCDAEDGRERRHVGDFLLLE